MKTVERFPKDGTPVSDPGSGSSRGARIHWSKSDTVGIPSVGDTFPFTVVSSPYVLLLFGPRIWSCSYLLGNQWETARGDSLGDEVRVGEVSLTQPPLVGTL